NTRKQVRQSRCNVAAAAREERLHLVQSANQRVESALLTTLRLNSELQNSIAHTAQFLQRNAGAEREISLHKRLVFRELGYFTRIAGGIDVGHVVRGGFHRALFGLHRSSADVQRCYET